MEILILILLTIIDIGALIIFLKGLLHFYPPYSCRDNRCDGKIGFLTGVAGMTMLSLVVYAIII